VSRTISEETWLWARVWLEREVQEILDDPSIMEEPKTEIEELQRIAVDLELDFDELVSGGTPYEIERLKKLLK
jgi:hypothetical protein